MITTTPFSEGNPDQESVKALHFLRLSFDHTFHPCGSRFFGDCHDESDYDFFVKDSPEVRQELVNGGWEEQCFDYPDHNSVCVLKMGEVHVITVHNVEARLIAQQYIITNKLERPKQDSDWWCRLYEQLRDKGMIQQWWDADVDDRGKEPSTDSNFEWKPN